MLDHGYPQPLIDRSAIVASSQKKPSTPGLVADDDLLPVDSVLKNVSKNPSAQQLKARGPRLKAVSESGLLQIEPCQNKARRKSLNFESLNNIL